MPGGGDQLINDPDVLQDLVRAQRAGVAVAGVCTGVMVLSAAGLTKGRPFMTHHLAKAEPAALYASTYGARYEEPIAAHTDEPVRAVEAFLEVVPAGAHRRPRAPGRLPRGTVRRAVTQCRRAPPARPRRPRQPRPRGGSGSRTPRSALPLPNGPRQASAPGPRRGSPSCSTALRLYGHGSSTRTAGKPAAPGGRRVATMCEPSG